MAYQATFKRYELKYLLSKQEKEKVLEAMAAYMELDKYGRCTIRNIYLDTDNFRLIRRSLEKPVYKEKLRIRSYRRVGPQDTVFVELKKKYKSVVYKRRLVFQKKKSWKAFERKRHYRSIHKSEMKLNIFGNITDIYIRLFSFLTKEKLIL